MNIYIYIYISSRMAEKKYCFSCQSERGVEHFEEGFKSCKVCREQRNTNRKHISANYAILKERLDVRQNTKKRKDIKHIYREIKTRYTKTTRA
jgi:hypothetical protein